MLTFFSLDGNEYVITTDYFYFFTEVHDLKKNSTAPLVIKELKKTFSRFGWTTDMKQSFPHRHKSLLEDAMDTTFKLCWARKEETKNEASTLSSFLDNYILSFSLWFSVGFIGFILLGCYRYKFLRQVSNRPLIEPKMFFA